MFNFNIHTVSANLGATLSELAAPPASSGDKVHYQHEAYKAHTERLKVLAEIETNHMKAEAVSATMSKHARQLGWRTLILAATCTAVCGHFLLK